MPENKNPFARAAEIADQKFEAMISRPGRKARTSTVAPEPELDQARVDNAVVVARQEVISADMAENQHHAMVRAVAAQVGYQLPADCADPDLIQRDIAANMRRSVEACLEVGRGLAVLKAACHHGMFMARLDVLGIDRKVAAKFMQAANKFSNVSSTRHLTAALSNQTKLFEMLVLDDEQLEELELTGQTGELKLDDVATMSVKELRAKVRELRNEVTSKEEVLATRSAQINTLEEKLSRAKALPPDEVLTELQAEATKWTNDAHCALIGKFSGAVEALATHFITHGGESINVFMAGLVGQLQADLNALRDRCGIPDVTPAMIPDWVSDPNFDKAGA